MTYRLRISRLAQDEIDDFASYLGGYSEDFAAEQIDRLNDAMSLHLGQTPLTWSHFALTGPPYRAYLFRVGRRTQFWIVYTVDAETRTVNILRFWSASRDPGSLDLEV